MARSHWINLVRFTITFRSTLSFAQRLNRPLRGALFRHQTQGVKKCPEKRVEYCQLNNNYTVCMQNAYVPSLAHTGSQDP